jgi:hypothetical protein
MATYKSGKDCKVTLGANTVVGMGTWAISGITADQMDASAFNDNWKTFEFGMKDGGTIFSGLYDAADTTGREALQLANLENTDLTTLRLYIDDTSYYEPCQTTGYHSPTDTTGANDTASQSMLPRLTCPMNADKADLVKIDFTCKVSGVMVLV